MEGSIRPVVYCCRCCCCCDGWVGVGVRRMDVEYPEGLVDVPYLRVLVRRGVVSDLVD